MSYSFTVTASSKDEAKEKIADEFDRVELSQPVHAADREPAEEAANAFVNVLADPSENEELRVSVSGSVGWREEGKFTHSNVSVSASRQQVQAQS